MTTLRIRISCLCCNKESYQIPGVFNLTSPVSVSFVPASIVLMRERSGVSMNLLVERMQTGMLTRGTKVADYQEMTKII